MLKVVLTLVALATVPLASARPRAGTLDSEDQAVDFPEPNAFLQDDEATGRTQDHLKSAAEAEGEEANRFDQWAEANGGLASEEKSNSEELSEWRSQEDADQFGPNELRSTFEKRRFDVNSPHPSPYDPRGLLPRHPPRIHPHRHFRGELTGTRELRY